MVDNDFSAAERRISLWRKAIFLHWKTTQEEGPFYSAGYSNIWCEGKSIENKTPDIFGFSDNYYSVCDISMSPQKGEDMQKYGHCTPSDYIKRVLGITQDVDTVGHPFLITDEFGINKYPGYNLIQMNGSTEVTIESIKDNNLKVILEHWKGFLTIPPSFQLMAVPESTLEELKKPIATILKWATSFIEWTSTEIVVERLLGYLYDTFSIRSKRSLRNSVEIILYGLSQGLLKGFLHYDSNEKKFKLDVDFTNTKSRKSFSDKLNEWLEVKPIEHFINIEYRSDIEEDENEEDELEEEEEVNERSIND